MLNLENYDNERLRILLGFILGFLLLSIFGGLSFVIALGTVKAETSYGLGMVLGGLNTAIGAFAIWAWNTPGHKKPETDTVDQQSSPNN